MSAGPGASSIRGRTVSDLMASMGHEQIVYLNDHAAGLRAVIAIHSTALGPALGGVRFWHYPQPADAVLDALRLSAAMTSKAAVAGLHQGGGKAVVHWAEPDRPRPPELLRALGRAIDELGGRYLAAEDVGATTDDMNALAHETPWVTGVSESLGGSGDPSPVTAVGVRHGMRATCAELDGEPSLRGRRVVVQGAGHVGSHLVRLLVADGADVVVSDIDPRRADVLAQELGIETVAVDVVLDQVCDVLAPCALGGVLDDVTIPRLHCRAIVGAANNQLAGTRSDRAIAELGILFAPDFVVNAGGIINIAEEFTGYDRARALASVARIEATTAYVFSLAKEHGITPLRAAERLARQRIEQVGSRHRWEPGDPAAWTAGEPLRTLRPV